MSLRTLIPTPAKRLYHRLVKHPYLMRRYGLKDPKLAEELFFWEGRYKADRRRFSRDFYASLLLEIAGAEDASFLEGQVVADFGCGPRGSLAWAAGAARRIGIDVLADQYRRLFDTSGQNMEYVASTETQIPLPDASIDVMFCVNALDHTMHPATMAGEMLRTLKSGGTLVGSFNLNLRPTVCEPSPMTRPFLDEHLLDHLEIQRCRIAPRGPDSDAHFHVRSGGGKEEIAGPAFMWVRGVKRGD